MQEKRQLKSIISSMRNVVQRMKQSRLSEDALRDIELTVQELNVFFFRVERLAFQKDHVLETSEGYFSYVKELERLLDIWQQSCENNNKNKVDAEFWGIYDFFKYVDKEIVCQMVIEHFKSLPTEKRERLEKMHLEYPFLQNKINGAEGDFSLIREHVEVVSRQIEGFKWLYEHLEDYRSKVVLNGILRYWFEFDERKLKALNETVFCDYYDVDILSCNSGTVVVDLGAYVGEAIHNYIKTYPVYKRIYAYEITPSTFEKLQQSVSEYENVVLVNKGVADSSGKMYVSGHEYSAANHLSYSGEEDDVEVEVVTLDEDIRESIGLIKMDIEGAEKAAIKGLERHIREEKPQFAVSAYHYPGDLVQIPELLHSMRDDYKFYLRYNGKDAAWPCDYVLFAV